MFFFLFLAAGDRWQRFLADWPSHYCGNRGSGSLEVMGTALLSILCGHGRYGQINSVRIVSEDVVRTELETGY